MLGYLNNYLSVICLFIIEGGAILDSVNHGDFFIYIILRVLIGETGGDFRGPNRVPIDPLTHQIVEKEDTPSVHVVLIHTSPRLIDKAFT